jgi:hypothetical protein
VATGMAKTWIRSPVEKMRNFSRGLFLTGIVTKRFDGLHHGFKLTAPDAPTPFVPKMATPGSTSPASRPHICKKTSNLKGLCRSFV